jgi:hypothetical protein
VRPGRGHVRGVKRCILAGALLLQLVLAGAAQAAPELTRSDRLDDRRYVASGSRAYVVGTQAGRFPAMGFHTRGEMGGIWSPPLKLLDGIWFAIDGQWLTATTFRSGYGYTAMDMAGPGGLRVRRIDVVPDGRRAVLVGLRLRSSTARRVSLAVDAHSELMSAYPWGETNPSQTVFNLPDSASFEGGRLVFREQGTPPGGDEGHDWAAVVGSRSAAPGGVAGPPSRGPQAPAVVCPASGEGQPEPPERCDDTAYGKGAGGQLRYELSLRANRRRTVWFAVAGSEAGAANALGEQSAVLRDPERLLRTKIAERRRLAAYTRLSLPGDRLLQQGIDWSKQNLADSVQEATDLDIRATRAGKEYPPAEARVASARFLAAGFPDYPWLFATDGEYTAFASVAAGQFGPIKDHLRALRSVSEIDNGITGKVVHEVVTDGSIYFGSNDDPGNTDETVKFPSAVALIWRWTGDDRFRDQMYGFAATGMRNVFERLDADDDGWPEGLGNVEREGMGDEKLDVAVYAIRGLRDLADMARSRNDVETARWAEDRAGAMQLAFERDWWMPEVPQYADSLTGPGNVKTQQRHWIGVTPMEAELVRAGRAVPGLANAANGAAALGVRERPCYGTNRGLFHTGSPGCDGGPAAPDEQQIFTLNTAVMAVGEGNYGRLDRSQQQRFTKANRASQLRPGDEQPGAMPEIVASPLHGRSIDRPFVERPSVLQAWGAYGTVWPVVHQQLGVRPDMGRGRLEVMPQVPPYQRAIAGRKIRIARRSVAVIAGHVGKRYYTRVRSKARLRRLVIGHTLPAGSRVRSAELNGRRVRFRTRNTNRGLEVAVRTRRPNRHNELVVRRR